MKRMLIGLVLAAVIALPSAAALTTITSPPGTVQPGWNMIGLPGIPVNPDPASVLAGYPLDQRLQRWEASVQGLNIYDEWSPEAFGNMLLTDGYWLVSDTAGEISYTGLNDNDAMDVWISLPKAGWTLIGNPFSYDFDWSTAKVVDGNVTVSVADAAYTNNWLMSTGFYWDSATQGLCEFGLPDDYLESNMPAWHGFWVISNVDKLALIFESS